MGQCKDCKWWDNAFPMEGAARAEWGECKLATSSAAEPLADSTLAVAQDYEGYRAYLETAPDFGCVQFKAKDTGS